jgi:hypothetical protein
MKTIYQVRNRNTNVHASRSPSGLPKPWDHRFPRLKKPAGILVKPAGSLRFQKYSHGLRMGTGPVPPGTGRTGPVPTGFANPGRHTTWHNYTTQCTRTYQKKKKFMKTPHTIIPKHCTTREHVIFTMLHKLRLPICSVYSVVRMYTMLASSDPHY